MSSSDKSKGDDAFYQSMMNAAFRYHNKRVYGFGLPPVPSEEEKEIERILIEMSREKREKRRR